MYIHLRVQIKHVHTGSVCNVTTLGKPSESREYRKKYFLGIGFSRDIKTT